MTPRETRRRGECRGRLSIGAILGQTISDRINLLLAAVGLTAQQTVEVSKIGFALVPPDLRLQHGKLCFKTDYLGVQFIFHTSKYTKKRRAFTIRSRVTRPLLVDAIVAWGDVKATVDRVRAHQAAGADHVCIQVLPVEPQALPVAEWRKIAAVLIEARKGDSYFFVERSICARVRSA